PEDEGDLESPKTSKSKVAKTTDFSCSEVMLSPCFDQFNSKQDCPQNESPHKKLRHVIEALPDGLDPDYVKALTINTLNTAENREEAKFIAEGKCDNNRESISPWSFCSGDSDAIESLRASFFPTDIHLEEAKKILGDRFYLLLQEVIKSPSFLDRLKLLIFHESNSALISTGRAPQNCQDAKDFLLCLQSIDPKVLMGSVSAVLSEIFLEHNLGQKADNVGATNNQEFAPTSECCTSSFINTTTPKAEIIIPSDLAEKVGNSSCSNVDATQGGNVSMPELGNVRDAISNTDDPDSDDNVTADSSLKLGLADKVWEEAYDLITLDKRDEKMRKMAQILFTEIFSDEEILECTVKGKKGTRVFDIDKVRGRGLVVRKARNKVTGGVRPLCLKQWSAFDGTGREKPENQRVH
ncbi:hypothetical protein Ocin01_08048, partial [Orchesella cincta]